MNVTPCGDMIERPRLRTGLLPGLLTAALAAMPCAAQESTRVEHNQKSPMWCTWQPPSDSSNLPGIGKTVVLISGDEEYRSEEALPMLGKLLANRFGFTCHCLFAIDPETGEINPNNQENIPGMHLLDSADLIVMALRFRHLPDDQMKHFVKYLESARPIVALRTSTHAFRYPDDSPSSYTRFGYDSGIWKGGFGKQVLGETWVNHHGHHGVESTRGIVNPSESEHVLLTGVEDVWGPTDVYGTRQLPSDSTILLYGQVLDGMQPDSRPVRGEKNDPMMPLAWVREHLLDDGSRIPVFCTTLGAATDFESAGLRRLIVNTALSMTDLEAAITTVTNVDPVGDYRPGDFGFDKFRRGLKPADYQ